MAAPLVNFLSPETGAVAGFSGTVQTGLTAVSDTTTGQGAYAFRQAGTGTTNTQYVNNLSSAEVYASCHVLFEDTTTPGAFFGHRLFVFFIGANAAGYCQISRDTSGRFFIEFFDSNNTWTGTSYQIPSVTANTWYKFEVYIKSNATTGRITAKWEGTQVLDANNINTRGGNITIAAGLSNSQNNSRPWRLSELCFATTGWTDCPWILCRQGTSGTPSDTGFTTLNGGATSSADAWSETPFSATKSMASASTTSSVSQTMLTASFASTQTGHGSGTIGASDFLTGIKVAGVAKTSSTSSGGSSGNIRYRIGGSATNVAKTMTTSDAYYDTFVTAPSYSNLNSMEIGWSKSTSTAARVQTVEDVWLLAAYVYNPAKTLLADAGSYAINGVAATATLGHKVIAAAASYSLSGTAATLSYVQLSQVSGSTTLTLTPTGAVTGTGRMVASSAISFSQTAAVIGSGAVTGSSTVTFSQTGALIGLLPASGSSTVTFSQIGAVTGSARSPGSAALSFSQSGALSASGALVASSSIAFSHTAVASGSGAAPSRAASFEIVTAAPPV